MIISMNAEKKTCDKNLTPFRNKNTQQTKNRRELLQPDKGNL